MFYDPPPEPPVPDKLAPQVQPMLNNYARYARIGNGHHGEVFLCFRIDGRFPLVDVRRWFPVAMKSVRRDTVIDKYSRLKANRIALTLPGPLEPSVVDKLNTTELKIKKEIAIMKKLSHPNVVRLFEVIDDRMKDKVYMVMEYLGGGEIKWRTDSDEPTLTLAQTRRIMRDAILGLEYLHYQGIIHRDIKPANLLWTEDRHHVKIADFGVSHFSYAQRLAEAGEEGINIDELEEILMDESDLTKRAGTPAFLAPELIFEHFEEKNRHFIVSSLMPRFSSKHPAKPQITKSIDVWALGVTLYCLLFGKTPFLNVTEGGATEFALYRAICNKDWETPERMCRDQVPTGGRHSRKSSRHRQVEGVKVISLLERFLQKDQTKRITLDEVKRHHWITEDLLNPPEWAFLTSPHRKKKVEVTKSDMFMAVNSVHLRWGLGGFGRGMSALFRPLRTRSRATPVVQHYTRTVGGKSDQRGRRPFPHSGNRKSSAISGVQDVHVYARTRTMGEKVDSGKGKTIPCGSSPPTSSGGLSAASSSPALDAIRRQRSQMGILGHEQRRAEGEPSASVPEGTPISPKFGDIMSIITWRPTKYPTPTTSLTPLLANIHADGTSTFRSRSTQRARKPHASVHVVTPVTGGPPRTVSTLEGGLRPGEDMLGIYGPESSLVPDASVAALSRFKRASSWGQGDEVDIDHIGIGMNVGADVVSVTSMNAELNATVKLMGAGGVESLGSPVSPVTPVSPEGSGHDRLGSMSASGSGSPGDGIHPSRSWFTGESGGWRVGTSGSAGGSGSAGDGGAVMNWDQFGESIRKWRDYRKKHHHRNDSSSTLPWVDSLDDVAFGVKAQDNISRVATSISGGEESGETDQEQSKSRGELTMEWMDDNYTTPGGYYGTSMGPATQFWRHGRGAWSGGPTSAKGVNSSGGEEGSRSAGPSTPHWNSGTKAEVVRRREVPLDKFLSGESSDSSPELSPNGDGDNSDYGSHQVRRELGDDNAENPGPRDVTDEEESGSDDDDDDDDDDDAQQITFTAKGKTPVRH